MIEIVVTVSKNGDGTDAREAATSDGRLTERIAVRCNERVDRIAERYIWFRFGDLYIYIFLKN
jgi:hypothetical protein